MSSSRWKWTNETKCFNHKFRPRAKFKFDALSFLCRDILPLSTNLSIDLCLFLCDTSFFCLNFSFTTNESNSTYHSLSLYLPGCLFYLSTSISLWILIHLNIGIILSLCFSFFVMYLSLCLNFSFDTNTFKCKYHFLSLSYNLFPSLSFLYFYRNCSFITITFKYRYRSLSLSFSWCYIFLSTSISLSILIRSNIGIILCLSFLNCLFIFLPQLLFQYLYI